MIGTTDELLYFARDILKERDTTYRISTEYSDLGIKLKMMHMNEEGRHGISVNFSARNLQDAEAITKAIHLLIDTLDKHLAARKEAYDL
nr:hypothetical protein 20 [bacterium]